MYTLRIFIILSILVNLIQSEMEGYIVNGENADIKEFPHSAFLSISCASKEMSDNWSCGSSVINQLILLTAAHCLESCSRGTYIGVSVGSEHKKKGAIHHAKEFKLHPGYDEAVIKNDIALVKVKSPINFNSMVKRVALMKYPPNDNNAAVSGWGKIDEINPTRSYYLKWTKQIIWAKEKCTNLFKSMGNSGTFCAGLSGKQVGFAAQGDSGSALVIRNYIQVGIVSYKTPAISRSIVIYTNISYFYDWIEETAKELYCTHYKNIHPVTSNPSFSLPTV